MLMKGEHCSMKNKKDKDNVLKIVSSVFTEEWLRMMEINPKFFLHDAESALRRRRFEVGGLLISLIFIVLTMGLQGFDFAPYKPFDYVLLSVAVVSLFGLFHFGSKRRELRVSQMISYWTQFRPAVVRVFKYTQSVFLEVKNLEDFRYCINLYLRSQATGVLRAEAEGNEPRAEKHRALFDEVCSLGVFLEFRITKKDFYTNPDSAYVGPRPNTTD